ncbi:MAG: hypothetical protein MPJ50_12280 [Pirellulales bacterium]|nr:hypothetical protein [Pirellulales bacterium]
MKRFGFAALAVMMLVASIGCRGTRRGCGYEGCGYRGCNGCAEQAPDYSGAHVGYPYYTTRSPRDYFLNNPPSIGR